MKAFIVCLLLALAPAAGLNANSFSVTRLKCEYMSAPTGIGTLEPHFSWQSLSRERGFVQGAYEITVGDDKEQVAAGKGNMWSEKRRDRSSLHVRYGGKPLSPGTEYYWSVRIFDSKGRPSPWAPAERFSTGLISEEDWSGARWIALEVQPDSLRIVPGQEYNKLKIGDRVTAPNALPQFRREFDVRGRLERAVAYVSGLGQFELFVNGRKTGDHFLDPAWSDYDRMVCYAAFDVTDMLSSGANVLGVMLGNGMYNVPRERYYKLLMSYGYPMMIMKLDLEYEDGTHETVVSDGQWKAVESPVTYSSIFGGEDYDATLELAGWMEPGYDDSGWKEVRFASQKGRLTAPVAAPVRIMEEFPVYAVRKTRYGAWLYDLGQNFSGIPCITVRGSRGQSVRMHTCELFDPAVDSITVHGGYRGETCFTYTLKGSPEPETWHPQFTYHGFRYVLVSGAVPEGEPNPEGLPEITQLKGLHIRNSAPSAGSFECSNPLLNRTEELIRWGIKSNMVSYLTDCPHREKLPWLEQLHLMFGSLQYSYDFYSLYCKMMSDMALARTEAGLVPDIAPEYARFLDGFYDSPEWGSSVVLVPWKVYEYYGDDSLIRRYYDTMAGYVEYLGTKAADNILSHGLGDWCDLGPKNPGRSQLTSLAGTATPVYYMDAVTMAKAARLLGKDEDVRKYTALADSIKESYNRLYFHEDVCFYDRNSQTANAIALCAGLVDPEYVPGVTENLVKDIRSRGNALTGGDIGYNYILRALESAGRSDVIFDMNSRYDVYGYGYMLAKGATALPESWQALPMKSHNHFMLGHLMEWFYTHLGGIRKADDAVAFSRFTVRPCPVGDVTGADVSFESPYGLIRSEWEKTADRFFLTVEVPANTEAEICLPCSPESSVRESGIPAEKADGLSDLGYEDGCRCFSAGSGIYRFEVVL